jgi:pimeloyl-ACP methyl ester carboxylesterase
MEFRRADPLDLAAPSVVVAHSLGGLLAAELAAARPDVVRALVLVAPVGVPRPLAAYATGLVRALAAAPSSLVRVVASDALRWGAPALARAGWAATRTAFAGTILAPTLLVWGERDRVVPVELAETWRQMICGARVEVIPGAGHVPMLEAPSAFNQALHHFLDDLGV